MQKPARHLVISFRLSVQELRAMIALLEDLKVPHQQGVMSSALRAITIRLLEQFSPDYEEESVESCLEWLSERGYDVTSSARNRRAVSSQRSAEAGEETGAETPDLVGALRSDEPTREEIEQEALEVGAQLDEILAKIAKERQSKNQD